MESRFKDEIIRIIPNPYRVGVFFSGGIDSSALLHILKEVFGQKKVLALFASLPIAEGWEEEQAKRIASNLGIKLVTIEVDVLASPHVRQNSELRCYHCKKLILSSLIEEGRGYGVDVFVDGSTSADKTKVRPGSVALAELGVISPLAELGIGRFEIRKIARKAGCREETVSGSCMATRFQINCNISDENIVRLRTLEDSIRERGFSFVRARLDGDAVTLEVPTEEVDRANNDKKLTTYAKELGFRSLVVHLDGYLGEI